MIDKLARKQREKGFILKGCSMEEINSYENKYGIKLPAVYVDFLKTMGKNAGDYMRGSDFLWHELSGMKEYANELLQENSLEPLKEEDFVFWMHQGYIFSFFKLNDGNDPKVYGFNEGEIEKGIQLKFNSLTDYYST